MNTNLRVVTFKDVQTKTLEKAWLKGELPSQKPSEGKEELKWETMDLGK